MKNILAIIPARSKSKGIKNKNIKKINEKNLIYYTIKRAKDQIISFFHLGLKSLFKLF